MTQHEPTSPYELLRVAQAVCRLCYDQVHRLSSYRVTGVRSSEKRSTPLYFQNTPNRHGSLGISPPSSFSSASDKGKFSVSRGNYVRFLRNERAFLASFVERKFIEFGRGYNAFSLLL